MLSSVPDDPQKPLPPYGWVCPRCGMWDADGGRKVLEGQEIVIDLAGLPGIMRLARHLKKFKRDLVARGLHVEAKELEAIITDYEIHK